MEKVKIISPIILVIIYTSLMLFGGSYLKETSLFNIHKNTYINFQANYQLVLLLISTVSLLSTYLLNRESFSTFFNIGNISVSAQEMKWFGIKSGDSWLQTGLSLSIFITLATAGFMYFPVSQISADWPKLAKIFVWILLFSITNSFGEEMIFRLGIVSPLKGLLSPMSIFIISAILFGLPHLAGMPSGLFGAIMAGVLGLILAKSMFETKGFFWAWFIHLLQDLVIISSLFLMQGNTK